jgi:hypothetical protein
MTVENLSLIFGPTFMEGGTGAMAANMKSEFDCIKYLILYHEWVFFA